MVSCWGCNKGLLLLMTCPRGVAVGANALLKLEVPIDSRVVFNSKTVENSSLTDSAITSLVDHKLCTSTLISGWSVTRQGGRCWGSDLDDKLLPKDIIGPIGNTSIWTGAN